MSKWNEWDDLLKGIKEHESRFVSINEIWRDATYAEELSAAENRHAAAIRRWQTMGTDVSTLLEIVRKDQDEKRHDDLLDWLCTLDPSEAYNAARDKHTKGTSDWLISSEEFEAWKTSASSLLWLSGKPGCGKSILSSSVIKHLRHRYELDPETCLAYFFFSFTDPNKQNLDGMLASLLKQIYARRPDTANPVESLRKCKENHWRPDTETLEAAILASSQEFSTMFIIIDALDECPSIYGEREKLLTSLSHLIDTMPANIHILCTSRAEPDIVTKMGRLLSKPSRAKIDLMTHQYRLNHDIGLYIDETLSSDSYRSWPGGLKEHAKELLIEKADGMFQYVSCQFEALRVKNLYNEILIRDELEALPTGLDEAYDRLFLSLNEHFRTQIISVLKWLASSNRDLRLEELAEIFVLRPESGVVFDKTYRLFEPSHFIEYMSSLIVVQTIPDMARRTMNSHTGSGMITYIRLAHFTVKEYLMSDRITTGPAKCFSFNETDAHLHVVHSSLAYLHSITLPNPEVSGLELREYALENWMLHLEKVPRELWPDNVENLAIKGLKMGSKILRTILEADEYTIRNLEGWDMRHWWRAEMLKRPHLYTAAKGNVNLTTTLISGGPRTTPYLIQEDMDMALHCAALAGSTPVVQLLMDQDADWNSGSGEMGSALHAAAYKGHIEIVKLLLDRGAEIDAQHGKVGSALHVAISQNHFDIVQLLIRRGSDINALSNDAGLPLTAAVERSTLHKNLNCLRLLLDSGVDINRQSPTHGPALHHAAANRSSSGKNECIRLLLEGGADVNLPGGEFGYPLQAMCYWFEDPSDVMLLLDSGADVNARGGDYDTVLQALFANWRADSHQKRNIAGVLLDKGANVKMQGGWFGSALQSACNHKESIENARWLVDHGADVDLQGGYFGNALQAACSSADLQTAQLLLDMGANVNALGGTFGSPLQAAACARAFCPQDEPGLGTSMLQLLLGKGAEVDMLGGFYGTALQAACVGNNVNDVQILLKHGANVNSEGGKYGSALQAACHHCGDGAEIPRLLIEHGANVHEQGGMFGSAWHAAAAANCGDTMLLLLLEHAIDIDDARGRKYATALHAALESDSYNYVRDQDARINRIGFLLDHGANANVGGGEYGFPLQAACANEEEHSGKVTKFLLEKCPEINVNAIGGVFGSALQAAAHSGQTDSVCMLLDRGANVNVSGGIHRSPLSAAIFRGYWDIVEVLLEKGAIPDSQPDEEWLEDVRGRLGRGAVERYWKFWEKTGSQWNGTQVHREHQD